MLASLAGQPCSPSPRPSPLSKRQVRRLFVGSSIVFHDLHPRVCADREDLGTLHSACVDEDDLACKNFVKAVALVDEPCGDCEFHHFGLVREGFGQAGFLFLVLLLVILFVQPSSRLTAPGIRPFDGSRAALEPPPGST